MCTGVRRASGGCQRVSASMWVRRILSGYGGYCLGMEDPVPGYGGYYVKVCVSSPGGGGERGSQPTPISSKLVQMEAAAKFTQQTFTRASPKNLIT